MLTAAALAIGCGGAPTRPTDLEQAVERVVGVGSSAGSRGTVEAVQCGKSEPVPGGQLVGCRIRFSQSGTERWFALAADRFYVLPCPKRPSPLASLVRSVCGSGR